MDSMPPSPPSLAGATDAPGHDVLSNETYLKNMACLWNLDPALAYRIDDRGEPRDVAVERAKTGEPTASMLDAQGRRVYLHSRYNPVEEAGRLVDGVKIDGTYYYVLNGLGLGHHLKALFQRAQGEGAFLIFEPSLDVLAAAMFTVDLSPVFEAGKCMILTRIDKDFLHQRLETHGSTMTLGLQFVSHPPSERLAGPFHQQVRKAIQDYIAYARMSIVTVLANARITCKNIANNLPTYLTTPPIDGLRGRFGGLPAIVISAGPSLARNIDQLAALGDRAVLIAVQTMLKPLLRRGVRPHFVTTLDFHEISRSFFDGLSPADMGDLHLIAEPKATWHVLDRFAGTISVLDNEFARLCVGDALAARDGLPAGATVAHLSYYFANYLRCDPIIFVGQDLGYSDNVFYTPGVALHDTWRPELNRFNTIEMKEWERIVRRRSILRKIEDVHGQPIYTDETLFTYLQQFEKDFAAARSRIIDATEGGARKAGTEVMTLAEAAARYCTRPLPADCFAYPHQPGGNPVAKLQDGRDALTQRMDQIRTLRDHSRACTEVLHELQGLTHNPDAFNRKLARVDEIRALIHQHEDAYKMVNMIAQHAELRRHRADLDLKTVRGTEAERAKRQLVRDIEFTTAMTEAAEELLAILEEALQRVEAAIAARSHGEAQNR
jgi:hypothetical protein